MEYDNTNRGISFPNDRKETDKHPDFKGSINVEGKDYWLSGWNKQTKGGPAISWSVQPKEDKQFKRDTVVDYDGAPISLQDIPF